MPRPSRAKSFARARFPAQFTSKRGFDQHVNTALVSATIFFCLYPGRDQYYKFPANLEQRPLKTYHDVQLPKKGTRQTQKEAAEAVKAALTAQGCEQIGVEHNPAGVSHCPSVRATGFYRLRAGGTKWEVRVMRTRR